MTQDSVSLEVENGIALVCINRPQARNAVDGSVTTGLAAALDSVEARSDIAAAILTGAGEHFCAGMDLKAFLRGENVRAPGKGFAGMVQAVSDKPWIAAVEGYALAGGFEIALWCDLIVASETAKFGLPEVKRGLVANAGGLLRLPRQLPQRIAAEMVLTGDAYPAATLAAFGLINLIVPAGQALTHATVLAARIAANGPLALAASKRVLREASDWSSQEMFAAQNAITAPVFTSEDAKEGALAFAEKRAPKWRGV